MLRGGMALVAWFCCVAGCNSVVLAPGADAVTRAEPMTGDDFSGGAIGLSSLDEQISSADRATFSEGHADLGPVTALLQQYAGDLHATRYICEHMDHLASHCWTRASEINPQRRNWICDRMLEHVGDRYEQECRSGVPWPLVYKSNAE